MCLAPALAGAFFMWYVQILYRIVTKFDKYHFLCK